MADTNPYYKGHVLIKGSKGSVTIGAATVLKDDALSGGWKDVSKIDEHVDAGGVLRTLTRDMIILEQTYEVTPGLGDSYANDAALATNIALLEAVRKGDAFIATGFQMLTLNCASSDKAIVWDVGGNQSEGQAGKYSVTVRKFLLPDGTAGTPDFTAAWAVL